MAASFDLPSGRTVDRLQLVRAYHDFTTVGTGADMLSNGRLAQLIAAPRRMVLRSAASLGRLKRLPPELLAMVLDAMSLASVVQLRKASRGLRAFADALSPFNIIVEYAPQVIQGALALGLGEAITAPHLWEALRGRNCANSGEFGGFLYLLTCKKACRQCLSTAEMFHARTLGHAMESFDVKSWNKFRGLRIATTVPGAYGEGTLAQRHRHLLRSLKLVDGDLGRAIGAKAFNGDVARLETHVSTLRANKQAAYNTALAGHPAALGRYHSGLAAARQWNQPVPRRPRPPQSSTHLNYVDRQGENPMNFACVVAAPVIRPCSI